MGFINYIVQRSMLKEAIRVGCELNIGFSDMRWQICVLRSEKMVYPCRRQPIILGGIDHGNVTRIRTTSRGTGQ